MSLRNKTLNRHRNVRGTTLMCALEARLLSCSSLGGFVHASSENVLGQFHILHNTEKLVNTVSHLQHTKSDNCRLQVCSSWSDE